MSDFPAHMWLAGDGEGVIFVCEGPCRLPDHSLVIAAYGDTGHDYIGIPTFSIGDLTGFHGFIGRHAATCRESR